MPRPLEGIRVLDLGISTAGPYCARFLADLGAEVLKIEPLDGENARKLGLRYGGTGYLYHVNNYNKKSVSLQVQTVKGREIFLELVAKSSVVVENFAIGTMTKWGIGYEACRDVNPSIIYCSAKGFGESGPLKHKRAFDTVTQAISGIMHLTGEPGEQPLKGGPSICDLTTAAVSAMAVMSAVVQRREGESQFLDTALFDMGAWSLLWLWPLVRQTLGKPLGQIGNRHPLHCPYGDFATRDGRLFVTVTRQEEWGKLGALLALPESWSAAQRKQHEGEIEAALVYRLREWTAEEAAETLQKIGVPAAPVLDIAQVAAHELIQYRRMVVRHHHPVYGEVPLIQSPLAASGGEKNSLRRLQPTLGENSDEIIGGLLGRAAELEALRRDQVIG